MREVTAETAQAYLVDSGRIAPATSLRAARLAGGVSNEVLLVESDDSTLPRFVLKQARGRLRTPLEWNCTVERIWREVDVLAACREIVGNRVPEVLFVDRENYLYAMTAAPAEHAVWRDELLAGKFDPGLAREAGEILGSIHRDTWNDPATREQFADRQIFHELRIAPYYETVADRYPDAQRLFEKLIASLDANLLCLVHADFSPKNLLAFDERLMLVDFETGHFGDPAFDLGFFLAHLVLKAFYHAPLSEPVLGLIATFLDAYCKTVQVALPKTEMIELARRTGWNLGGCLWARLDGTSQVDYLVDESRRARVRALARELLSSELDWPQLRQRVESAARD